MHVTAGDRDVLDVAHIVERASVGAVASEYQHITRAGAAVHGVGAAQVRTEDDRVVAVTEVDAVDTAARCVNPVAAVASTQRVVGTAEGDEVIAGGGRDQQIGLRFRSKVAADGGRARGVDRGIGRRENAVVAQCQFDMAGDDDFLDVAHVIEFIATQFVERIVVDKHVGSSTAQQAIHAVEEVAEIDRVVTHAGIDVDVATARGAYRVVTGKSVDGVVADAQLDGVISGTQRVGAQDDELVGGLGTGVQIQGLATGCVDGGLTGEDRVGPQRDVDVAARDVDALDIAHGIKFGAVARRDIGVNQHIGASTAVDDIGRRQVRAEREGVVGPGAGDGVGGVGRDVVEAAGAGAALSRCVERAHAVSRGCIDSDHLTIRDDAAVAQHHIDSTGDAEVLDARNIVQFRCAAAHGVGVGQGVGACAVAHHVAGGQRRAEVDAVVASIQRNGVIATTGGDDQIIAITADQAVVASAAGDGVVAAGADAGHVERQAREVDDSRGAGVRRARQVDDTDVADEGVGAEHDGMGQHRAVGQCNDLLDRGGAGEAVAGRDGDRALDDNLVGRRCDGIARVAQLVDHRIAGQQIRLRGVEISVVAGAAVQRVDASAAVDQVVAQIAAQVVVAGAAAQGVAASLAVDDVVVVGADDGIGASAALHFELILAADEATAKHNV